MWCRIRPGEVLAVGEGARGCWGGDQQKVGSGTTEWEWRGGAYSQETERDGADEFADGGCGS